MPRHLEKRRLPFTPEQMFSVVADVAVYPEFLPWCKTARVYNESPDGFEADLVIGFKMFSERFTSKVGLERPSAIYVDYVRGPMKYLHNDWRFAEDGAGGCLVDFVVDFEFKNRILETLIGALFEEAVHRMVLAFETRAQKIYG